MVALEAVLVTLIKLVGAGGTPLVVKAMISEKGPDPHKFLPATLQYNLVN